MATENIDHLCRICVNESHSFKNIYDLCESELRLYEIINDLCRLDVYPGDDLPRYVCAQCHGHLLEFRRFKRASEEGKAMLLSIKMKMNKVYIKEEPPDVTDDRVVSPRRLTGESIVNYSEQIAEEVLPDRSSGSCARQVFKGEESVQTVDNEVFVKCEPPDSGYEIEPTPQSSVEPCNEDVGNFGPQILLKIEQVSGNYLGNVEGPTPLPPGFDTGHYQPEGHWDRMDSENDGSGSCPSVLSDEEADGMNGDEYIGSSQMSRRELYNTARRTEPYQTTETAHSRAARMERLRLQGQAEGQQDREQRRRRQREERRRRLEKETPEERSARLQRLRLYNAAYVARETPHQRVDRLWKMRMCQSRRLARESREKREERLLQLRLNQVERLERFRDRIQEGSLDCTRRSSSREAAENQDDATGPPEEKQTAAEPTSHAEPEPKTTPLQPKISTRSSKISPQYREELLGVPEDFIGTIEELLGPEGETDPPTKKRRLKFRIRKGSNVNRLQPTKVHSKTQIGTPSKIHTTIEPGNIVTDAGLGKSAVVDQVEPLVPEVNQCGITTEVCKPLKHIIRLKMSGSSPKNALQLEGDRIQQTELARQCCSEDRTKPEDLEDKVRQLDGDEGKVLRSRRLTLNTGKDTSDNHTRRFRLRRKVSELVNYADPVGSEDDSNISAATELQTFQTVEEPSIQSFPGLKQSLKTSNTEDVSTVSEHTILDTSPIPKQNPDPGLKSVMISDDVNPDNVQKSAQNPQSTEQITVDESASFVCEGSGIQTSGESTIYSGTSSDPRQNPRKKGALSKKNRSSKKSLFETLPGDIAELTDSVASPSVADPVGLGCSSSSEVVSLDIPTDSGTVQAEPVVDLPKSAMSGDVRSGGTSEAQSQQLNTLTEYRLPGVPDRGSFGVNFELTEPKKVIEDKLETSGKVQGLPDIERASENSPFVESRDSSATESAKTSSTDESDNLLNSRNPYGIKIAFVSSGITDFEGQNTKNHLGKSENDLTISDTTEVNEKCAPLHSTQEDNSVLTSETPCAALLNEEGSINRLVLKVPSLNKSVCEQDASMSDVCTEYVRANVSDSEVVSPCTKDVTVSDDLSITGDSSQISGEVDRVQNSVPVPKDAELCIRDDVMSGDEMYQKHLSSESQSGSCPDPLIAATS